MQYFTADIQAPLTLCVVTNVAPVACMNRSLLFVVTSLVE